MQSLLTVLALLPFGAHGQPTTSQGSCYDPAMHVVACDVAAGDCGAGNIGYEQGYVCRSGCCHCEASCDHSQETEPAAVCDAQYYDASAASSGSCYDPATHYS
mgnify:CR=1 FL=1|jgi:hypothetical protein